MNSYNLVNNNILEKYRNKMATSFKVKDYKCFASDEYQGFDKLKQINVLIGKNNSGKSKLLEALERFVKSGIRQHPDISIQLGKTLTKDELQRTFATNVSSGRIGEIFRNHSDSHCNLVGCKLVGSEILLSLDIKGKNISVNLNNLGLDINSQNVLLNELQNIQLKNPFDGYKYLHLQAERDIKEEPINFNENTFNNFVKADATNITSLIARMINDEAGVKQHWKEYIEIDFLDYLNKIVSPEIIFTRIYTMINSIGNYEIYLEEANKGGIKLSDCGSGLKTIIATLTLLHIIPYITNEAKFVFAFEELENNMHPSLERKLLRHIRDYIKDKRDMIVFLTTHSNVAIDLFGNYSNAQIVKVCNDGYKSTIENVITDDAKRNLLNELGIKASDLLQSNCAIWVEGPSDRIYIKKWLEVFDEERKFEEGLNYQFIFYGGSLLSHYSANNNDLINLLKINKNSYVIMDSDKKSVHSRLKERVTRIKKEMPKAHWITQGKEIENYLPSEALTSYFGKNTRINQFELFPDIFKRNKRINTFDKVSFAKEIIQNANYTKETLSNCLDLKQKIKELINFIEVSNQSKC